MNQAKSGNNNLNNYKTKKCRHFEIGKCKLGALCNFAHGDQELRDSRNPDSINNNSKSINNQKESELAETYEKILLLENRMEATYNTQRMLISKLKQTCQSNNILTDINAQNQVTLSDANY